MKLIVSISFVLVLANSLFAKQKPNIILIMADDVGWECFSDYGGKDYKTPHLNRMAKEGMRFEHCYSTPICTTSRVKLMTGKYNFRNYTYFGYLDPKERTFAHMLKDVGYKTAIAGKWQLNGLYNKLKNWEDNKRPHQAGFDEYCLWQVTTSKGKGGSERFWSPMLEQNGEILSKEKNKNLYGPDIMSDFLCDFIEKNKKDPFFVYYPMVLVHDPFVPTPDNIGNRPRTHEMNKQSKKEEVLKKNFVAMVGYMDKVIGKIIQKVESIGQLENTIIMFTADNGTHIRIKSNWKETTIRGGKGGMKDMGTHVPFYALWKGKTPAGKVSNDLIDFTDFYATLAEAAGYTLTKNDPTDGRSFLPQLKGEKGSPRDWLFCHYEPYWNKIPGQFVRTQDYKLYHNGQFYNVPNDLNENKPIEKSDAKIRQQLQKVLDQAPPAPKKKSKNQRQITNRPVFPDHKFE